MKERPILFSAPMVRAILEGRKTQTRRIAAVDFVEQHPAVNATVISLFNGKQAFLNVQQDHPHHISTICPHGMIGDRLWVKETAIIAPKRWADPDESCIPDQDGDLRYIQYLATHQDTSAAEDYKLKKTPSIHMPRWASRMTLEITNIRVERLNEISKADAIAEGVDHRKCPTYQSPEQLEHMIRFGSYAWTIDYPGGFKSLWESINGEGSWDANPWVWVIEFERIEGGAA